MRRHIYLLVVPAILILTACKSNPVAHDDGAEDLSVTLQTASDNISTLEEVTFTATITDHHGGSAADLEEVSMDYRLEGNAEWHNQPMSLSGSTYSGVIRFFNSGDYQMRVMGRAHGHTQSEMLHEVPEHLHVERAHTDISGYRVEFEAFPGEIHEGETSSMTFWVMQDTDPLSPVPGLAAEIHCSDPSGQEETHTATESAPGSYEADHSFLGEGETHIAIHFPGGSGEVEAEFHFPVSHGH